MPKIVDHDEYRQKLVQESFELMARRGYAALSMRDLARALRISTGTLYHYFPSKLGLFEAILQHYASSNIRQPMSAQPQISTFEDGLNLIIANCEAAEEMWAKMFLIQVDAYREPDGKMLAIYNNIFTSSSTKNYLSKILKIEDPDVIDLFRVIMLGMIIQRVISKRNVKWSAQKQILLNTFKQYAKD